MGCTSVSSTLLNRTDGDMFYGNSNGKLKSEGQTRPFEGIPITVKVPTHVDVAIKEKIRFKIGHNSIQRLMTCKRHLFVDTSLIHTDKVFTVDIQRPAAGTLDYEVEFGTGADRQYFDSIKSKIVDETIADTTTAINAVITAIRTNAGEGDKLTDSTGLIEEVRTVAWKRFDIDAPDFELAVSEFVDRHLNCCNSCQEYAASNCPNFELAPMPETQTSIDPGDVFSDGTPIPSFLSFPVK